MDKQRAMNQSLRARQDRLVAQQALARRFRLRHPREFDALLTIRDGLVAVFKEHGRQTMWHGNYPLALSYWLTTAEYPSARKALRDRSFGAVYRRVAGPDLLAAWEATLEPTCELLRDHLDVLDDLLGRFNYFDHVGLLSMASLCSGQQLHRAYGEAARDLFVMGEPEYRLFMVSGLGMPLEVRCSVNASAAPERFASPSLHILDSRSNPTPGVDGDGTEAVYLRIDLSRAPAEIDHALQYLRSTLVERFREVHEDGPIPDWNQFQKSLFAKAELLPLSDLKLLHDNQQMIARFRGFWCWDVVNSEAAPKASKAAEEVSEQVADENGVPGPLAVQGQYELVSKLILPKEGEDSELDMFYTRRRDVRLGLRSSPC